VTKAESSIRAVAGLHEEFEGTFEAIIPVKASPQVGKHHGETLCCAGVNDKGE
jgi:hypothetical protein